MDNFNKKKINPKDFIERYNARVENFRNYLSSGYKINFMMMRYNDVPNELCEVIQEKYPNLDFEIHSYINYSPYTYSMTHQKDDNSVHEWEMEQWRVMGMSEEKNPNEFERYKRPFSEGLTNNYPDKINLYVFE